ncbi:MAG: PQQ-binding-like beta-propeller repeat protein [Pirellulales bacterium]|nr:PQQ-binding-like beta-propeller repeat protein [Pirellulales bacterium]
MVLVIVAGVLHSGPSQAAQKAARRQQQSKDWPQWRGPNRDGHSPDRGLLDRWPDGGPPLVWTARGLGSGYSSVAVAGGVIYTLGGDGSGTHLAAVDAADGSIRWKTRVGAGSSPNSTPTVHEGLVYTLTTEGDLACVDARNGELRWSKNFGRDYGGRMMSGWGYSESPLVDGEKLVCTPGAPDGVIVALDRKSGATIWKAAMPQVAGNGADGAGYSSIVVSTGGGVRQYVQLVGRGVIGVAAEDGKFLWGYNRIANGTANIPTPIVQGDYVFCSTGYGAGAALLKLSRQGRGIKAEEVYFLDARDLQNHHGGMVLVDKHVYCGHGHNEGFPACVELDTGRIAWKPGRGPGAGSAAVAYADGCLYFRYQNGLLALVRASPRAYELRGQFMLPEVLGESWSHPVIIGGRLYLREQDLLYCYNVAKPG